MIVSINDDKHPMPPKPNGDSTNGRKQFEKDNEVLTAMAKAVAVGVEVTNNDKIEMYGKIQDMAIFAKSDNEYNVSLVACYGKRANKNTRAYPAALIIGSKLFSLVTDGYKTQLRKMFIAADQNNYTGEQLKPVLRIEKIKGFIKRAYSPPNPSSSTIKAKKDKILTTGNSNANAAVASANGGAVGANSVAIGSTDTTSVADSPVPCHVVDIGSVVSNSVDGEPLVSNTIFQPAASIDSPTLPHTEFITEYNPGTPLNSETIYISVLKHVSGPILFRADCKRGHVVIGQVNISAMTTVHETDADNNPNIPTDDNNNTLQYSVEKPSYNGKHNHIESNLPPLHVTVHPITGRRLSKSQQYWTIR